MRCDIIASGIIKAHKHIGVKKPVVIRLRGNKVEEAMALLETSDVPLILVDDYEEAAAKAIEMSNLVTSLDKTDNETICEIVGASTTPPDYTNPKDVKSEAQKDSQQVFLSKQETMHQDTSRVW